MENLRNPAPKISKEHIKIIDRFGRRLYAEDIIPVQREFLRNILEDEELIEEYIFYPVHDPRVGPFIKINRLGDVVNTREGQLLEDLWKGGRVDLPAVIVAEGPAKKTRGELLAQTFMLPAGENPLEEYQVTYINGDETDQRLANIYWVNLSNVRDNVPGEPFESRPGVPDHWKAVWIRDAVTGISQRCENIATAARTLNNILYGKYWYKRWREKGINFVKGSVISRIPTRIEGKRVYKKRFLIEYCR